MLLALIPRVLGLRVYLILTALNHLFVGVVHANLQLLLEARVVYLEQTIAAFQLYALQPTLLEPLPHALKPIPEVLELTAATTLTVGRDSTAIPLVQLQE
jgi:hypothetical protein